MKRRQVDAYLWQYGLAAGLLAGPHSAEAVEEMVGFLCGRDALASAPQAQERLIALDEQFARALASAPREWQEEVREVSAKCGFAAAAWWVSLLSLVPEEAAATTPDP